MESKGEWDNRGLGRTTVSLKTARPEEQLESGLSARISSPSAMCLSLSAESHFLTADQIVRNRFGTQERFYPKLSSFKFRSPKQGVYWPL